ncbi:MAG: hypothetical protein PHV02_10380 [Rhodocyclaceae bacterium]|nr:hypothetical protein [Rhodocyclaceae bacterium]
MKLSRLALILAVTASITACANKETRPEVAAPTPAPVPAPTTSAPTEPVVTSAPPPDCVPATKSKKKKKPKKGEKPSPPECPPAAKAAPAPAAPPVAAAPPAAAPAASAGKGEPGKPRIMKSTDGTFEGEVYGNIPPGSKWAKLQIGMDQSQVERILGVTHEVRHTPTGKAFIPFYYGTDRYRNEHVYRGQGSVSYTSGGHWGAGRGVLMMINYDPNI